MPHFRVDDAFHSHPKAQRIGDDAIGLWTRAGSFCMAYLTDGFVPEWWVKQQPNGLRKARKLVTGGLWHDNAEKDGEKGYQFHEFVGPGRQDSREKIEADRELARKRQQKSRIQSREESQRDTHRDNTRESHQESRRSPGYTQPNPTQPLSVVTSGGELTQVSPHCARHPHGTDHPCHACADARRAHETSQAQHAAAEHTARQHATNQRLACTLCDDNGLRDLGDHAIRCTHQPTEITAHA